MGIGVRAPAQLSTQAMRMGYDKQLRMKSLLQSIFVDLKGIYNTETKTLPNAIIAEVSENLSDSSVGTITMKLPLRATGVYGNAMAITQEELPVTKSGRVFRNNCRKVIAKPGYGARKLDADYLKLYDQHIDDLATWNRDEEDLEIQQAHLERFGETLLHGDTAVACVQNWNPNWFQFGLPLRTASPVYSSNSATYTARIVQKIVDAGNGSLNPTVNQTLNAPNLSNLSNFCLARRMNQLAIPGLPGGRGWVLTFSELQAMYLGDPAWCTRNLGNLFLERTSLPDKVQEWEGVLGAYKNFLLVSNPRAPTVLPTGSSAPFGLTSGYVWHGDTDLRNRDHHHVRDVIGIWGKGSLIKWVPEKLHTIEQTDDYGAIVGVGTALVRGYQQLVLDLDTPGAATHEQFFCGVALAGIPDYV